LAQWEKLQSFDEVLSDPRLRAESAEVFASGAVYAYLRNEKGDQAYRFLIDSLPPLEGSQNLRGLCVVHQRLGIIARETKPGGTLAISRQHLEKAREYALQLLASPEPDHAMAKRLYADSLNGLGAVAILEGDLVSADASLREANVLFGGLRDQSTKSSVMRHLAEIARLQHRPGDAVRLCAEAIQLALDSARQDRLADGYKEMAMIEAERGAKKKARGLAEKAQRTYLSIGAVADARRVAAQFLDDGAS
jgi:hypothetical protein